MNKYIGLDYETFSSVPLGGKEQRGLANYVASPDFRVLLASTEGPGGTITFDWVFNRIYDREFNSIDDSTDVTAEFLQLLVVGDETIMAHNAPFERAVTHWLYGDKIDPLRFQDSAVDGRALGAESKLLVASRQLTNSHKLEEGHDLVMLFCVPNELYPEGATAELIEKHGHEDKWLLFIKYCEMDARGSRDIRIRAEEILADIDPNLISREAEYEPATWEMNQVGWHVDKPLVQKMKQRAWANSIIAQRAFLTETGDQINFNSHQQLKKYLEQRGVQTKSLDKYHLPAVLERTKKRIAKLEAELHDEQEPTETRFNSIEYAVGKLKECEALLETKLEIGGSTLSKLPVILNLLSDDDILRDQYIHFGAGQTGRSTARGAQMQNIKKLDGNIRDMETIYDLQEHWSNGDMAGQLRQVFTSRHPEGEVLVGDFAGVESRGLAFEAGEEWKLQAFQEKKDVYCMLVTRFNAYTHLSYDEVADKEGEYYQTLRPRGKYSELSCQYQASGSAVQEFMFRLGFSITIEEATQNVVDWRGADPAIVEFWMMLDDLLKEAVSLNQVVEFQGAYGLTYRATPFELESMSAQHPGSLSLALQVVLPDGQPFVTRFVHGCYFRGNKLCYYKPADNLNGELWKATYKHKTLKNADGTPKDVYYSIYGGKLAGIFTQSLCREIFFESLTELRRLFAEHGVANAVICGQFHDEINVDWWPGGHSKEEVMALMRQAMTHTRLEGFPLDAEIKGAHRYIK